MCANRAVNKTQGNDENVLWGEIHKQSIECLENILSNIFVPLTKTIEDNEWGQCDED